MNREKAKRPVVPILLGVFQCCWGVAVALFYFFAIAVGQIYGHEPYDPAPPSESILRIIVNLIIIGIIVSAFPGGILCCLLHKAGWYLSLCSAILSLVFLFIFLTLFIFIAGLPFIVALFYLCAPSTREVFGISSHCERLI